MLLSFHGHDEFFKGLGIHLNTMNFLRAWEYTSGQNDTKCYMDPHEQEVLLNPSIPRGRDRTSGQQFWSETSDL